MSAAAELLLLCSLLLLYLPSPVSVCLLSDTLLASCHSFRGFDDDADVDMRARDRWGDPMAGKLTKSKVSDGFDLPPPVITEANREMMEASGNADSYLIFWGQRSG